MPMRGVVTTTSGGGVPSSTMRIVAAGAQVGAGVRQVEAERLAQLARAVGEVRRRDRAGARVISVDAPQRRQRPQQHGLAVAVGPGHDVGAVVHAVA